MTNTKVTTTKNRRLFPAQLNDSEDVFKIKQWEVLMNVSSREITDANKNVSAHILQIPPLCNDGHLLSLSTFRHCVYDISQVSAESLPRVLWLLLQVGVNERQSAQMRG